ncbi:MAG: Hsp70 family protein [Polyangiales bacterium]
MPGLKVRWAKVASPERFEGALLDADGVRVRLVTPERAAVGDELHVELIDDAGGVAANGFARVVSKEPASMHLELLAIGWDTAVLAAIPVRGRPRMAPPPLPPVPTLPPPRMASLRPVGLDDAEDVEPLVEPLAPMRTGVIIGIDLGTTNTCASYVKDGRPQIIPGRTGTNTIPSMITFDPDGTFHVGQRAADRHVLHPLRTVYGSKRLIGRTYRAELAAELQGHFAYPLGEAEGQRFGVRIDDRVISMDTIAARVLDEVRSSAEAHLKTKVEAAIITVPAYFTEVQREAVRRAAAQAQLAVYRIVNEPTAAAVAYGHKQQSSARIAVWDFGGGTFDFSIVDVSSGELEVIATGGDNFVGGSDFDDIIAAHLLEEFQCIERITFDPDPQQIARLRDAAEKAKRELSVESEHVVELAELTRNPKRHLRVELTVAQFDLLTKPLVERTLAIAHEVMKAARISPKDIDDVLLVGGTTRVPAVQRSVAQLFQRRPSKRINPDEAVALGAALLADEIGGGPTLVDILPMTIGRGTTRRGFQPIVERYTRVPVTKEITVDADILGSVYVPLFQGESRDVAQNEYLCSVIVEDRSLWDGGHVVVRLSFDQHCVMTVDAFHAKTRKPLPLKLDRSRPVQDVLRDLGGVDSLPPPPPAQPPASPLAKAINKLFKLFGR